MEQVLAALAANEKRLADGLTDLGARLTDQMAVVSDRQIAIERWLVAIENRLAASEARLAHDIARTHADVMARIDHLPNTLMAKTEADSVALAAAQQAQRMAYSMLDDTLDQLAALQRLVLRINERLTALELR